MKHSTLSSSPNSGNTLVSGRPVRIQRSRQSKQVSPNGLPIAYVGRPGKFGNPFTFHGAMVDAAMDIRDGGIDVPKHLQDKAWIEYARGILIQKYKNYLEKNPGIVELALKELKGKNLSCWCKIGEPCHADVLLELVNR